MQIVRLFFVLIPAIALCLLPNLSIGDDNPKAQCQTIEQSNNIEKAIELYMKGAAISRLGVGPYNACMGLYNTGRKQDCLRCLRQVCEDEAEAAQ